MISIAIKFSCTHTQTAFAHTPCNALKLHDYGSVRTHTYTTYRRGALQGCARQNEWQSRDGRICGNQIRKHPSP